jgi:hypothetical protein
VWPGAGAAPSGEGLRGPGFSPCPSPFGGYVYCCRVLTQSAPNGYFAQEYGTSSQSAQNAAAAQGQQRQGAHGVEFGADARLAQLTDAWVGK